MAPPSHHKEVAVFLREVNPGDVSVNAYRDNSGKNAIPVGKFGGAKPFFSTIGIFDEAKCIPVGDFEFSACGEQKWLPNVIASSIYWLKGRECSEWPLVCEDVVRDNARSTYRHMAFIPSVFKLPISTGQEIQWLLGIPITDNDICLSFDEVAVRVKKIYPQWLFNENREA